MYNVRSEYRCNDSNLALGPPADAMQSASAARVALRRALNVSAEEALMCSLYIVKVSRLDVRILTHYGDLHKCYV